MGRETKRKTEEEAKKDTEGIKELPDVKEEMEREKNG